MGAFLFGPDAATGGGLQGGGGTLRPGTGQSEPCWPPPPILTLVTVGLNLYACGLLIARRDRSPILSGLAVAFGGWILFDEVQTPCGRRGTVRPGGVAEIGRMNALGSRDGSPWSAPKSCGFGGPDNVDAGGSAKAQAAGPGGALNGLEGTGAKKNPARWGKNRAGLREG